MGEGQELAVCVCEHVFRGTRPVLRVSHDVGAWQFLCGGHGPATDTLLVIGMDHVLGVDPTTREVLDLPLAWEAERDAVGERWTRRPAVPPDADGDALRRLAEHADLSRPITVDFEVRAPSEAAARAIAAAARAVGYEPSVEEAPPLWDCCCRKRMLATYASVVAAQRELRTLSSPHGGHVDGWGSFGE